MLRKDPKIYKAHCHKKTAGWWAREVYLLYYDSQGRRGTENAYEKKKKKLKKTHTTQNTFVPLMVTWWSCQ